LAQPRKNLNCLTSNWLDILRLENIYTRTGPILIAMNPFKALPLYGDNVMQRYRGKPYGDMPPHPYQESEDCLQRLQELGENQCVVICGESGAGKTETTKARCHI
jgi:myosin heavy subunit